MRCLGLDCSTQSLTGLVIDVERGQRLWEASVIFDDDLPHWGTTNGVLPASLSGLAHSPPAMWAEALEMLLERLAGEGPAPDKVRAIAVSGQQHGTVYLTESWPRRLATLATDEPLAEQVAACLSRPTSPIWQDTSSTLECDEIRQQLGGAAACARLTGSDVFERFSGPQIRRFWKSDPERWAATEHITLVSGFVTSLLTGEIAPLEPGDAAGMSLMDLAAGRWAPAALDATAPDLEARLPSLAPSASVAGRVTKLWRERCGFTPDTLVLPGSGDNPCTLVGLGLVEAGGMGVSLGTSDTYFGCIEAPTWDPRCEGHVFGAPNGGYMTLNCFRNGSLAREHVRQLHELDWQAFGAALRATPAGNGGRLMLPWLEPEIVPRSPAGIVRSAGFEPNDAATDCRAVVEGQALAMRTHAGWMGPSPRRLIVTGGASVNPEILQVFADVFSCPVERLETTSGAALGAALRAAHTALEAEGEARQWSELVAPFCRTAPPTIAPFADRRALYDEMAASYAALEKQALGGS
jgi:xylulokinase